jgi:hypothetical protein
MNYKQQWCFFYAIFSLLTIPSIVGQNRENGINLPSIVGEGKAYFFYAYYRSKVRAERSPKKEKLVALTGQIKK